MAINIDSNELYNTLIIICERARERSISDKTGKFIRDIGANIIVKKGKRESNINDYFDIIKNKIYDFCFIDLVAEFEGQMIEQVNHTRGRIERTLNVNYDKNDSFGESINNFIKNEDQINSLHEVNSIIEEKLSSDNAEVLSISIKYRNRLTHGKRFGEEITLSIKKLDKTLKEILDWVK